MNKFDYVRNANQTRPHTCHWPNCGKQVPPAMWGCKTHWFKLPADIRNKIWSTYKAGQEETVSPSAKYLEAAREAEEWIKNNF